MHSKLGDWSPHTHKARDDRNPDTLISFKRHTRKGSGSVATTPGTTRLSKRCVHSSAIIGTHSRLRRKSDRNPVTLISFKRHTRKRPLLARLRQRQVQRGSRSDACTARRASEPSDTLISFKRHTRKGSGSVATTRSSPQKLDEAMLRRCVHSSAMIATLTHLDTLISPSHATLARVRRCGSVATAPSSPSSTRRCVHSSR